MSADPDTPEGLRYRGAAARRELILSLVRETSFCTAADLSERLGVSTMTIRRDIRQLAEDGLVRSGHGGVSAISAPVGGVDFQLRARANLEAKRAIARHAASLLDGDDGTIIGLDAGTTVFEMLPFLSERRLTVVTHSLPVMTALSSEESVEVIGLGGLLHPETQAFAGPATVRALADIRIGTVFLAASAVRDGTVYCGNAFDAETKRALAAAADQVVLLVDASKFSIPAVFSVGAIDLADVVVVDDMLPDAVHEQLRATGVRLDVVGHDAAAAPRR